MEGIDILNIVLKIAEAIIILFWWIMSMGAIFSKIDESKKEIINMIEEQRNEYSHDFTFIATKIDGCHDALEKLKKKKKKKDKVNFIDIPDGDL